MKETIIETPIIVALDFANLKSAQALVKKLNPKRCRLKVGKEIFTRGGPQFVEQLVEQGFKVFLDLKFNDIPNTVAAACDAAADLGVWMVDIHISGGRRMIEAARNAIDARVGRVPLLAGVTLLTSIGKGDLQDLGIKATPAQITESLALLGKKSGLDGVICSAQEAAHLRRVCGDEFVLVSPGIRPAGFDSHDQVRVMTPKQAMDAGVHYMVIGRSITQASDPLTVLTSIEQEIS